MNNKVKNNKNDILLEDLYNRAKNLIDNSNLKEIHSEIASISSSFNELLNKDLDEKKQNFVQSGGDEIDFFYNNILSKKFKELINEYNRSLKQLRRKKLAEEETNLKIKEDLIEQLKNLIQEGKPPSEIIDKFKNLKQRWYDCGNIPRNKVNIISQTFLHHQKRFYDYLNLNREFRDVEYARNLEEKKKLIQKIKELNDYKNVRKAFMELQQIHKIWKQETGPVSPEISNQIWKEFKEASDVISNKFRELKKTSSEDELRVLNQKNEILKSISEITSKCDHFKNHPNWQNAMKRVNELRENFVSLGNVPIEYKDKLWKDFRDTLKQFNDKKNKYFRDLKCSIKDNDQQKQKLIHELEKIIALSESQNENDLKDSKEKVLQLQKDWKKIGFTPKKRSDVLWHDFVKRINTFFDIYNKSNGDQNITMEKSFMNKKDFLEDLLSRENEILSKDDISKEIENLIIQWKNLEKTKKSEHSINNNFYTFVEKMAKIKGLNQTEISNINLKIRTEDYLERGNVREVKNEYFMIKDKINALKRDLTQFENNINLFRSVNGGNIESNPILKNTLNKLNSLRREKEKLEYKENYLKNILTRIERENTPKKEIGKNLSTN